MMETSTDVAPSFLGKRKGETLSSEDSGESEEGADVEVDLEDSDSYWDKDSFDGREYHATDNIHCSDHKLREQIRFYKRRVIETKGFFEPDERFPDMISVGISTVWDLEEEVKGMTAREFLGNMACECVEKYNKQKKKNVKFDHFVRANFNRGGRTKYYITFAAREYDFGPLVEYQAKVIWCAGKTYPVLCRPSPLVTVRYREKSLEELREDEKRIMERVGEIAEYFHGDVRGDEKNPLRIFVIIRDFLGMLDHVCRELRCVRVPNSPSALAPFR